MERVNEKINNKINENNNKKELEMKTENKLTNFSIIKALFIFYFIMLRFSGYSFTKSVKNNILSDTLCKHIINLIILLIIFTYLLQDKDVDNVILKSLITYILFIFFKNVTSTPNRSAGAQL